MMTVIDIVLDEKAAKEKEEEHKRELKEKQRRGRRS